MAFFAYNQQPNHPFWDFIASMDNQSNGDFQRRGPPHGPHHGPHGRDGPHRGPRHQRFDREEPAPDASEKEQNALRQPSVEDENMTDAEARPAKRSMVDNEKSAGEENKATEGESSGSSSDEGWGRGWGHGRHGRHGGRHGGGRRGWGGPGPFGPFGFPMFGPEPWNDFGDSMGPPHHGGPRGRHGRRHGPPGPPGEHPAPPEFDGQGPPPPPGPHGPHGKHGRHGPHGLHPQHHGPPPFEAAGEHPPPPPGFEARGPPPFGPRGHHGPHGPHGKHGRHHGPPGPPPASPSHAAGEAGEHPPPPPPPGFEGRHHGRCGGRGRGFGMRGGPFGPRGGPHQRGRQPFDLPGLLGQLSSQLGIDINAAAANFGLDLSRFPGADRTGESDFVPSHDTFNFPSEYLVHVSLPGAKKEDVGLDFDAEHNVLKVAGVAYRPGVDEEITSALVHDGRKSQVGVFDAKIPLSADDTVEIDVNSINAKLRDGILVIHVPKIQRKKDEKRTIRIATPSPSPSNSPERLALPLRDKSGEPSGNGNEPETELDMYEQTPESTTEKGDDYNEHDDAMHDEPPEVLPAYTSTDQHEHYHDDEGEEEEEEGEYVRVNVD